MKFINLSKITTNTSYDVMYVFEDNTLKLGIMQRCKSSGLGVLVDDEVYYEGRVVLLEPYTVWYKKAIFNVLGIIV